MTRTRTRRRLDGSRSVDRLLYGLVAACAVLVLADFVYHKHGHFAWEAWTGFYALYSFVACVFLMLATRLLRRLLGRAENYYDR